MFPDPSISPARYTKRLLIGPLHIVTTTDAEEVDWIRGFYRVVRLEMVDQSAYANESEVSLLPLHGISPVVKSLRVHFVVIPTSQAFDLILSFPLLEDLAVVVHQGSIDDGDEPNVLPTITHPSGPVFTGSLQLHLNRGIEPIARRLLSLPGGIHFRKLALTWYHERDPSLTMALVEKCSRTIETLDINCYLGTSIRYRCPHNDRLSSPGGPAVIDLSKATRLKNVVFRATALNIDWVITGLRTIMPKHREFQRISIYVYFGPAFVGIVGTNARQTIGEKKFGRWLDLDHLLIRLWESHSIRARIILSSKGNQDTSEFMGYLLPEITRRGLIDLI